VRVFTQVPIYFVGRFVPAGIAFFGIALYTRLLDPSSFGTYALLLTTSFLVGLTGFSWLRVATLRMMATLDASNEPDFAATIAISFLGTSLAVAAAIVVGLHLYNPSLPLSSIALTAAAAVASAWFELNITLTQARLKLIAMSALQIARAIAILSCSLLLIRAGLKANALLGGFAIGNCVGFAALGLWMPALRGRFRRDIVVKMLRFGWPSTAAGLSLFSTTFQRYMLAFVGGSAVVGVFSASNDFAQQTVGLLIATATLAGQPLAFRARDTGSPEALDEQLRNNARLLFAIGLGATTGLVVLAGPIAHVYLGVKFQAGAQALIAVSAVHCFIGTFRASYFEQAFEIALDTRPMAIITGFRIILTVALSLAVIPRYGALGAAVSTLVAETVAIVASAVWARRIMPVPIPLGSFAKVAVAATAMAGAVALLPARNGAASLALTILAGALTYAAVLGLLYARQVRALVGSRRAPAV
jgi:O-antigen/teichoic acid export membrane protein